jgi:hypothetical protein
VNGEIADLLGGKSVEDLGSSQKNNSFAENNNVNIDNNGGNKNLSLLEGLEIIDTRSMTSKILQKQGVGQKKILPELTAMRIPVKILVFRGKLFINI